MTSVSRACCAVWASSAQSGNVSFYQDVTLAAPGYAVTINAQGPQSGANFTGRGGKGRGGRD
mgnify:CR=1 FL=1